MKYLAVIAVLFLVTGCNQDEPAVKDNLAAQHAEQVKKFKEYDSASFQ